MLATARLLGQTIGAVAVGAGFAWLGLGASSTLLRSAAAMAALAALLSLSRLRLSRDDMRPVPAPVASVEEAAAS
jgi:hypothetical protein